VELEESTDWKIVEEEEEEEGISFA